MPLSSEDASLRGKQQLFPFLFDLDTLVRLTGFLNLVSMNVDCHHDYSSAAVFDTPLPKLCKIQLRHPGEHRFFELCPNLEEIVISGWAFSTHFNGLQHLVNLTSFTWVCDSLGAGLAEELMNAMPPRLREFHFTASSRQFPEIKPFLEGLCTLKQLRAVSFWPGSKNVSELSRVSFFSFFFS